MCVCVCVCVCVCMYIYIYISTCYTYFKPTLTYSHIHTHAEQLERTVLSGALMKRSRTAAACSCTTSTWLRRFFVLQSLSFSLYVCVCLCRCAHARAHAVVKVLSTGAEYCALVHLLLHSTWLSEYSCTHSTPPEYSSTPPRLLLRTSSTHPRFGRATPMFKCRQFAVSFA